MSMFIPGYPYSEAMRSWTKAAESAPLVVAESPPGLPDVICERRHAHVQGAWKHAFNGEVGQWVVPGQRHPHGPQAAHSLEPLIRHPAHG